MKTKDIISNIRDRLGITDLNAMQQSMASTEARDIILLAPTGSGKTLAFTIAMLRNLDLAVAGHGIKAAVIAPSRELVIQITDVIRAAAPTVRTLALYGGHAMTDEINSLTVTPDIIVATPGRLLDHIKRNTLDVSGVKSIVLDEYDKSLELGFADEMRRIIKKIRKPSLRILTSATRLADFPDYLGNESDFTIFDYIPLTDSPRLNTTVVEVPSPVPDKLDTLCDLLRSLDNQKVIVFANHRESAERIHDRLKKEHFPAGLYHGGLDQLERRLAVDMLNNGSTPILVATDLASRGLDIAGVGSVIHYHLPPQQAVWTHRNGRTARQGATGTVYAIVRDGETIPEFVGFDRSYTPTGQSEDPIKAEVVTIYFDAGKKEKISKGDILGYLTQKGGLDGSEVGNITVDDHYAIAAIPADKAEQTLTALQPHKLKNRRVRTSVKR